MILKAVLLGILQGITEFLPVSSSGHLRLASDFFHFELENNLAFDVSLHLATLLAVLIVFRKVIISTVLGFIVSLPSLPNDAVRVFKYKSAFRLGVFIIIATIPAVVAALPVSYFDLLGKVPTKTVVTNLMITGFFMLLTAAPDIKSKHVSVRHLPIRFAVIVGFAQATAILPGISRSGVTISSAIMLGASPAFAASFSFLMSIPAILGAALLEIKNIASLDLPMLGAGFVAALISGIVSLKFLVAILKKGKLYFFSFYCFLAAAVSLVYIYFIQ